MTERPAPAALLRPLRRGVGDAVTAASKRLSILKTLVDRELTVGRAVDIPLERRLWLWRRGFTSRSHALFDVTEGNYREYVSDYQHELADDVVGEWDAVVGNKLTFYLLFGEFSEHLPDLYGMVDRGRFRRSSPLMVTPSHEGSDAAARAAETRGTDAAAWVDTYLDAAATPDALVLKPVYGQGGRGVLVCRKTGEDAYEVNGDPTSRREFEALVADLDEYLAWEFVRQADYADRLFADSANTVRVITVWDYETDEPFVAGAVHRVGTEMSAPVDNWSQGGLSAEVADDGTLSGGAQWLPSEGEVRWFDDHPDTGDPVAGVRVPDWPAVRERIETVAAAFPFLPRLGWDVVLTGDGEFAVLEVNAHAATRTLQVHRPILSDPRVRRFYEHHGYV